MAVSLMRSIEAPNWVVLWFYGPKLTLIFAVALLWDCLENIRQSLTPDVGRTEWDKPHQMLAGSRPRWSPQPSNLFERDGP